MSLLPGSLASSTCLYETCMGVGGSIGCSPRLTVTTKLYRLSQSAHRGQCILTGDERQTALAEFYDQWKDEPLVILKWIGVQAISNVPGNVEAVKKLLEHPAVHLTNPNTCYSLFLGFTRSPVNFHAADGSGYQFLGDSVLQVRCGTRLGCIACMCVYALPMRSRLVCTACVNEPPEVVWLLCSHACCQPLCSKQALAHVWFRGWCAALRIIYSHSPCHLVPKALCCIQHPCAMTAG